MITRFRFSNIISLGMFSFIVLILLIDSSLARTFHFTSRSTSEAVTIYVFLFISFLFSQYALSVFIKENTNKIAKRLRRSFKVLLKTLIPLQFLSTIIMCFILIQLNITSKYSTFPLIVSLWFNYGEALFLTFLLIYYFLIWFKNSKSKIILSYAISIVLLSVNVLFVGLYSYDVLSHLPPEIGPRRAYIFPNPIETLVAGLRVSSILSFLGMWIATVIQLRTHLNKLGKVRSWVLISIPLIYFLVQFQPGLLNSVGFYYNQNLIYNIIYTLFFAVSRPIGGILFGVAFWIIGSKTKNDIIKNFMTLTAYGMVLFFVSNQAINLTYAVYPPFGLMTISFLGTGSFLLFVGIYSTSISVAQDISLSKLLRKQTTKIAFIENIGDSERTRMETRIADKALKLSKDMEVESGVPVSWDESDIHEYINSIYQQLHKKSLNT